MIGMQTMLGSVLQRCEPFVPPIIADSLTKLWRRTRGIGFHTFEGAYRTISDVPIPPRSYEDPEVVSRIIASRLAHLKNLPEGGDLPSPDRDVNGKSLLPLLVATEMTNARRLCVLDCGGGLGVALVNCLRFLGSAATRAIQQHAFEFHIVETPAMAKAVRPLLEEAFAKKFGSTSFLSVHDSIPVLADAPTIVNVASTIQYIPNYSETLDALAALGPKYILITETPMWTGERYARMQSNMPRRKLAQWVFNYSEFVSSMAARQYLPIFETSHDLPLTHSGRPAGPPAQMVSILFRRSCRPEEQK